jgi:isoamylase
MPNPPILWDIESDPALAGTKLIAEAWDAAGLYQVGNFLGDSWKSGTDDSETTCGVFFAGTCHDGFTLNDLVSYNQKHNEANGEGNRDGVGSTPLSTPRRISFTGKRPYQFLHPSYRRNPGR